MMFESGEKLVGFENKMENLDFQKFALVFPNFSPTSLVNSRCGIMKSENPT
jgi:hypothetical protein